MLILAFDTSTMAGNVALLDDHQTLAAKPLTEDKRSAQTLAPALSSLMRECSVTPSSIRLIATTIGPGSFTGLRVGVTTAKMLAYALNCPVMGLDTLEVLASQVPAEVVEKSVSGKIHAILDAQRRELVVGRFLADKERATGDSSDLNVHRSAENEILPAETWLASLQPGDIVTGAGASRWLEKLPAGVLVVDSRHREPLAATIGRLALAAHQQGRRDDLWNLAPHYIRPSYADEKRVV